MNSSDKSDTNNPSSSFHWNWNSSRDYRQGDIELSLEQSSNNFLRSETITHDHDHFHNDNVDESCSCLGQESGNIGHNHAHCHDAEESECECCDHSHDHNHSDAFGCCHDHDHSNSTGCGHDHDHSHEGNDEDCCGCSDHDHGHDHCHSADVMNHSHDHVHSPDNILLQDDTVITPGESRKCASCDPTSLHPHLSQSTRLRIANLCCSGEERIIRNCLEGSHGIESVTVNVLGRYIIVKHCPMECCASTDSILEKLNKQRLGASIHETFDEETVEVPEIDLFRWMVVFLLFALLIVGLATHGNGIVSTVLFLIGTGLGTLPILKKAFFAILNRIIDINILMLIAIIGALAIGEYFDSCLVVALYLMAEALEDLILTQVRKAVKLTAGSISKSVFLTNGKAIKVEELKVDDIYTVRAGDMVAADGVVVRGDGVVNESALTGESMPVNKKKESKVFSGTFVQNGYLEIKVTKDVKDGTMQLLQQTVDDLQADRGEYAKLVDNFAIYWTPFILLVSFGVIVIGGGVTGDWKNYVQRGLILLVLSCPCSILLAAPIPGICTMALAAKHGVLIKGSSVIERMGLLNECGVDKTGTLTKGFFEVVAKKVINVSSLNPSELAAAIESKSTHPLANAIVSDFCGCIAEMEGDLPTTSSIKVIDGVGVSGYVNTQEGQVFVQVGNERLIKNSNFKSRDIEEVVAFTRSYPTASIIIVSVNGTLSQVMALCDEIREESKMFVTETQKLGVNIAMLTGDHSSVAEKIAGDLEIPKERCLSRLLPAQKLEWIDSRQNSGSNVAMVGDGINDAAALSRASVGIAMGEGGSAMTVQAADVVILSDNLLRIPSTIEICRVARFVIFENCISAISIKVIAVILAAVGLLHFWEAVLVDIGALLVVVLNGTRCLFSRQYDKSSLNVVYQMDKKYDALPCEPPV